MVPVTFPYVTSESDGGYFLFGYYLVYSRFFFSTTFFSSRAPTCAGDDTHPLTPFYTVLEVLQDFSTMVRFNFISESYSISRLFFSYLILFKRCGLSIGSHASSGFVNPNRLTINIVFFFFARLGSELVEDALPHGCHVFLVWECVLCFTLGLTLIVSLLEHILPQQLEPIGFGTSTTGEFHSLWTS